MERLILDTASIILTLYKENWYEAFEKVQISLPGQPKQDQQHPEIVQPDRRRTDRDHDGIPADDQQLGARLFAHWQVDAFHRQRIDLLERASRNPYEHAVIATALSQGGVGGLSALLMYCISGGTSLEKAVNTRQFMWVRYYLAKDFRNNVQAGFSPDKAYKMTSCQMAIARLENSKKRYGRK